MRSLISFVLLHLRIDRECQFCGSQFHPQEHLTRLSVSDFRVQPQRFIIFARMELCKKVVNWLPCSWSEEGKYNRNLAG